MKLSMISFGEEYLSVRIGVDSPTTARDDLAMRSWRFRTDLQLHTTSHSIQLMTAAIVRSHL